MFRKGLMTFAVAAMLATGVSFARPVFVTTAPPRPMIETRPISPGHGFVWTPGFYTWNGRRYIWRSGAWVMPPRGRRTFMAGGWVHGRHGWYFRQGFWR